MKKVYLLRLIIGFVCAAFSLVGCVGGSTAPKLDFGGGDVITSPPSISDFTGGAKASGQASSLSEVLGDGPAKGLTTAQPNKGVNGFTAAYDFGPISGAPSSVDVSLEVSNGTLTAKGSDGTVINLKPQDATKFSNGLVGSVIQTIGPKDFPQGIVTNKGTYSATEVVMLGGKSNDLGTGLEHTNFGFWESRVTAKGTVGGIPATPPSTGIIGGTKIDTTVSGYAPFIMEGSDAVKAAPTANKTFNGTVLANAYDQTDKNNGKSVDLVGRAALTLGAASGGTISGDMTFTFENFYTLKANVEVDGSNGGINHIPGPSPGGFSTSDAKKNTTGINLTGGGTSWLSGQFYGGPGDVTGTEAVGTFGLQDKVQGQLVERGVRGAFGVKK
jgi:hypothetical protein